MELRVLLWYDILTNHSNSPIAQGLENSSSNTTHATNARFESCLVVVSLLIKLPILKTNMDSIKTMCQGYTRHILN